MKKSRTDESRALVSAAAIRLAPRFVGPWIPRDSAVDGIALAFARNSDLESELCEVGLGASAGRIATTFAELERAAPRSPAAALLLATARAATADRAFPLVWAVLNATPDSFSDGGAYADAGSAVARGHELAAEGADVIDVGGESTRPGAAPVPLDEECRRVLPVVERLARELAGVAISIDTMKAEVARRAVELGAIWVNDPSGGEADPGMLDAVAMTSAGYVCMHMRGTPRTMQHDPCYGDAVAEIGEDLRAKIARCLAAGIEVERLAIDPGIGFGKRIEHNLALIGRLFELRGLGLPILCGVSRKSFIGELTDVAEPKQRIEGSLAAACLAIDRGADGVRVHDVRGTTRALAVSRAIALGAKEAAN